MKLQKYIKNAGKHIGLKNTWEKSERKKKHLHDKYQSEPAIIIWIKLLSIRG